MGVYQKVKANETGRDFVVGDVHGMFDSVETALAKVDFHPERDRLFSVGDLIDRGPQSKDVVRFLDSSRSCKMRCAAITTTLCCR